MLQHRFRPASRHLAGLIAAGEIGPLIAGPVSKPRRPDRQRVSRGGDFAAARHRRR
jgi:hypothetical protein